MEIMARGRRGRARGYGGGIGVALLLFPFLALFVFPVEASAAQNRLYGKAWCRDEQGKKDGIPGVRITLVNGRYGRFQAVSSLQGNYRFTGLPSGIYEVQVEWESWRHVMVEGYSPEMRVFVPLCCGKSIRLNVRIAFPSGIVDYLGGSVLIRNAIDMSPAIRFCRSSLDHPGQSIQ